MQSDLTLGGRGGEIVDRRLGQSAEIDLDELPVLAARFDLRHVQQVGDEFSHAVDARQAAGDAFVVGRRIAAQRTLLEHP